MQTTKKILLLAIIIITSSCNDTSQRITQKAHYNAFLNTTENEVLHLANKDAIFWEEKLEKEPNQFPYLVKLAASQSVLFNETGNIEYLVKAGQYLAEANKKTQYKNASYLRGLARNYISQHRFKEALELLKKAEIVGENLRATQCMMFDVYLELGNYELAKTYLTEIRDLSDFDFLIRLSKWSDYEGNLEATIRYMERAKDIAESSNLKTMKQWVYTNLADYYGHAGKIRASYNHYLKALQLNPNNAYAKKGIAWIVYSHEKNPDEALNILEAIKSTHNSPDYYLLKAEIADYKGDNKFKERQLNSFREVVKNPFYGDMYNINNVLLLADEPSHFMKALNTAHTEVENRATPQTYSLLAWVYFNNNQEDKALTIMEDHVVGKTFEPEALYHLAEVYKANGKFDEAKKIKHELLESSFELGPLTTKKIENI
ncbi:lipopolysaccharide assembly protein LapB [Seonamhaeicola sp. ML3]|uniref:tetratricopeptide repeat protein n=1 Tax=Seonamhaeicola sp. ML3 TaxID=2937786 RepID=UPI00200EBB68|nr:tetratricopeptide repeat protein [Seonamhaeicola sp. ML3]